MLILGSPPIAMHPYTSPKRRKLTPSVYCSAVHHYPHVGPVAQTIADAPRHVHVGACQPMQLHCRYEKTVAHAEAALESARESLKQKNKRRQQKVAKTVRVKRKRFWFEKFHWFLAPGGYVVVSGQSAQENELIVKR